MEYMIVTLCLIGTAYCIWLTANTQKQLSEQKEEISKLNQTVGDLKAGIVPDFEEAKAAAKAVNDFNAGISAIMGYDPMKARKQMREGRKGEDE